MTEVKLEYLGEDRIVPGAKIWRVEAIHVTTTGNKRKFTEAELELAGRSLSFRPTNRNHDPTRQMSFPENMTMNMDYNKQTMAVEGRVRVADPDVNALIEANKIRKVSIEQIPTKGEACNQIHCEQHGVAFIGLAFLDEGIAPGDSRAELKGLAESLANEDTIENLIVSNEQRECKDCTDFTACSACQHKKQEAQAKLEADDGCMEQAISEIHSEHPDWDRDQILAVALSKCGLAKEKIAVEWHERWTPYTEAIIKQSSK